MDDDLRIIDDDLRHVAPVRGELEQLAIEGETPDLDPLPTPYEQRVEDRFLAVDSDEADRGLGSARVLERDDPGAEPRLL